MAMQLENVVPFGRSLDEYIQMFTLTAADLQKTILSVGDGPASLNAEGTPLGYRIQSLDPLYIFTAAQIRDRFNAVVDDIIEQIQRTPADWVWTYHHSPATLRHQREQVITRFCEDFAQGKREGRYAVGELPHLHYPDATFDLGLSSHLLFLYSDHFDTTFHQQSLLEMLRVCREVRVFPLLTLGLQRSPHLDPAIAYLEQQGFHCEIVPVQYELQKGGNEMLRVT
jgi:hypothetical protein